MKNSSIELVYPIYLDTPMMTAFLASLEGGLVDETNVEEKSALGDEKNHSVKAGFNLSGILSGLIGVGADAELARKISEDFKSQYKHTVRFPAATLFIRLRNLLIEKKLVKQVDLVSNLKIVRLGDLVEIQGFVQSNPALQIRKFIVQLMPIVEQTQKLNLDQMEITYQLVKKAKPPQSIRIGDQDHAIKNKADLENLLRLVEAQKLELENQTASINIIKSILDNLIPDETSKLVPFDCQGFSVICRTYSEFVRNEDLKDINDAYWRCLGKVIRIIPDNDSYDLLKGLPLGYIAQGEIQGLFSGMNVEGLKVEITNPVVQGPCLLVAPLAFFS